MPPGSYRITAPLIVPSNTVLIGSGHGMGFGCIIRPSNCAAFVIGGSTQVFQIRVQDLMIWPIYTSGASIDNIILIDNSYSVTVQNVRIHQVPLGMLSATGATIKLLGHSAVGGHGPCNGIIWDNLIVRNDTDQPPLAVLAARGCGTHRFICPNFESYVTLFRWEGGTIDWVAPYTERAGSRALHCAVNAAETDAVFTSHGGIVAAAASGVACAIDANPGRFDSFGTKWVSPMGSGGFAAYLYGTPVGPVTFHGIIPNISGSGDSKFAGVSGWGRFVRFPDYTIKATASWNVSVPSMGQLSLNLSVPGVQLGTHWARVAMSTGAGSCQLSAHVAAADTVTVIAQNNSAAAATLNGTVFVEACWV
jgi:hypothetical protein